MCHLHFLRPAIRIRAVAPVAGRGPFLLAFVFRGPALLAEYGIGLFRFGAWQEPLGQRMQGGFELLTVGFAHGSTLGAIDNAVQFFHIHIDAPARSFLLHN